MTTVPNNSFFNTEIQDYLDTEPNVSQREERFWCLLNIKSKFAMISTDQLISITDITWIEYGLFLKIKTNEIFIFLRVSFCCTNKA